MKTVTVGVVVLAAIGGILISTYRHRQQVKRDATRHEREAETANWNLCDRHLTEVNLDGSHRTDDIRLRVEWETAHTLAPLTTPVTGADPKYGLENIDYGMTDQDFRTCMEIK